MRTVVKVLYVTWCIFATCVATSVIVGALVKGSLPQ